MNALNHNRRMYARFTAFVVWALLAGSIVFWSLKLGVRSTPSPVQNLAVADSAPVRVDLSRLLGNTPVSEAAAPPPAESRFRLVGVVAPKEGRGAGEGVALIAVDGKPARPYRVGAVVEGDLLLKSVSARSALVGSKGTESPGMVLQVPPPSMAPNVPIAAGAGRNPAGPGVNVPGLPANAAPAGLPAQVGGGSIATLPSVNPAPQTAAHSGSVQPGDESTR